MRRVVCDFTRVLRGPSSSSARVLRSRVVWHGTSTFASNHDLLSSLRNDRVRCNPAQNTGLNRTRHLASSSSPQPPSKSTEKESSAVSTLASNEGASKSLTGPRITSKKGYLERENMIRETQKAVRQYYQEGMYQDALEVTHRLVDQVDDHFGRAHGVYASALSDMALMMKSMGQHKEATEVYLKALEVYREVYKGEENASFASTLHNLGMAFRAMAEESSKLEQIPLLERAAEAFDRCTQIREKAGCKSLTRMPSSILLAGRWSQILTNNHPDLQLARSRLAMIQSLLGAEKEATEAKLRAALDGLQIAVGDDDASTANAMTNLALFLKGEGQYEEATKLFTSALETRKELYGPKHVDVLVSMHNLSMMHFAAGREDEAVELQEAIGRIGDELGVIEEEQVEGGGGGSEGMTGDAAVTRKDTEHPEKQMQEISRKPEKGKESEDSVTAWRPGQNN